MSGDKHNPNVELVARHPNILPAVRGLPATGAIARTATNIRSVPGAGRRNGHALTLLVIVVSRHPSPDSFLSVLAAILLLWPTTWGIGGRIPEPETIFVEIGTWLVTFC